MKILIIGHACSPRKGSEPGFTWNWAWHLSSQHQVWVIAHPYDREGVSKFLENHPRPSLSFKWVDIPPCIDPWAQRSNGRGLRFHYMLWLHAAFKEASRLHEQVGFDIVHHVSYGSVSAPPPVHTLGIPFVWGPIGGAQQAPSSFRGYFGRTWPREIARNARVRLLPFSPSLRSAVDQRSAAPNRLWRWRRGMLSNGQSRAGSLSPPSRRCLVASAESSKWARGP